MTNLAGASIKEIAFLICTTMRDLGVTVVLTGGGAATLHEPKAHTTRDLDFVLQFAAALPPAKPILALGFYETKSRGIYAHPDIPFTLEFLPGPLTVGDEQIKHWDTWTSDGQILNLLTPFDSIRDRMSAAIHWRDPDSARQAAEIARSHAIDIGALRDWCLRESGDIAFSLFEQLLNNQ